MFARGTPCSPGPPVRENGDNSGWVYRHASASRSGRWRISRYPIADICHCGAAWSEKSPWKMETKQESHGPASGISRSRAATAKTRLSTPKHPGSHRLARWMPLHNHGPWNPVRRSELKAQWQIICSQRAVKAASELALPGYLDSSMILTARTLPSHKPLSFPRNGLHPHGYLGIKQRHLALLSAMPRFLDASQRVGNVTEASGKTRVMGRVDGVSLLRHIAES
ncbi:hypothetical protein QBC47DRAFT_148619 [Echria macrotheca]|uniref:Uncharacterized protein n=1 Tax=Echria macrotheca TaxID=438768 RepID=A0AAJ0FCT0_9PEZI|nr:hypothetical protein QBC47DRAFT_148619 [Echria macrotheca]